jgi:hypothetical protein
VSGGVASKGVGRVGRWPGEPRRGHVHGGACEREVRETEGADGWGLWASKRVCERAVNDDGVGPPDRGRKWARKRGGWRRQVGPTRQRERGSGERGRELALTVGTRLS